MDSVSFELEDLINMPNTQEVIILSPDYCTHTIESNPNTVDMQPLAIAKENSVQSASNEKITSAGIAEYTHWPRNVTLKLIEEYKENHKKVGVSIRSLKKLFEMIATTLNKTFGLNLTGAQVNNKFKTLERGYKNVIDNNNKTGRGRKYFEYEKEMDTIFGKQTKINPEVLLSETAVARIPSSLQGTSKSSATSDYENPTETKSTDTVNDLSNVEMEHSEEVNADMKTSNQPVRKPRSKKKTRRDILELIRQDRLEYQQRQVSIASEKLAIEKEKLKEQKRRNDILEKKNQLLKEYIEKCVEK